MELKSNWTMSAFSGDQENMEKNEANQRLAYAYANLSAILTYGPLACPVFND